MGWIVFCVGSVSMGWILFSDSFHVVDEDDEHRDNDTKDTDAAYDG